MKKLLYSLALVLLIALIAGCSSDTETEESSNDKEEEVEKKDQTIAFGVTPWTSTIPPTKIASLIIQDMGYDTEETDANAGSVYTGLARGDLDVFMDSWLPSHNVYLEEYEDELVDTAVSYEASSSGWVVPTYMEEYETVGDIVGNEDVFNNEMFGIEEGTDGSEQNNGMIEDYDLDMEQVNSSEGAMLAMAAKKMEAEEPVIFQGWRPHTMFHKYDIKALSNDKGYFPPSSIHVITNADLQENAPDVYEFLSNWSMSIDDIEEMIAEVDEGGDEEELARQWIEDNQDKVDEMLGK